MDNGRRWVLPSNFQFVALTNPCPCGNHGDPENECQCRPGDVDRYLSKLSHPLLDRIDLTMECKRPYKKDDDALVLEYSDPEGSSEVMYQKVILARKMQTDRFKAKSFRCNGEVNDGLSLKELNLSKDSEASLNQLTKHYQLSLRTHRRMALVARTIADLEGSDLVRDDHVLESFQYIKIRFKYWK